MAASVVRRRHAGIIPRRDGRRKRIPSSRHWHQLHRPTQSWHGAHQRCSCEKRHRQTVALAAGVPAPGRV